MAKSILQKVDGYFNDYIIIGHSRHDIEFHNVRLRRRLPERNKHVFNVLFYSFYFYIIFTNVESI